jgi:hypothetical protein
MKQGNARARNELTNRRVETIKEVGRSSIRADLCGYERPNRYANQMRTIISFDISYVLY